MDAANVEARREADSSSNQGKVKVTLVALSGKELELELQEEMTVTEVLESALPVEPLMRARLLCGAEELDREKTLVELGVESGARLSLVQSRRHCVLLAWCNRAELWCAETATPLQAFEGHTEEVYDVRGEEEAVLTASADATAKLWCACTGECTRTFEVGGSAVLSAQFSPNGCEVLTAAFGKSLIVWCRETGARLLSIETAGAPLSAFFSSCGQQLVTRCNTCDVQLWCRASGANLLSFADTSCVPALSPDGAEILVASRHGDPAIVTVATGERRLVLVGHASRADRVAFAPDGAQLLTGCRETVKLWSASTGECLHTLGQAENRHVTAAAFSPLGGQVLIAHFDHSVKLWNAVTGECLFTWRGDAAAHFANFNPGGDRVLMYLGDGTVHLWEPATGKVRPVIGLDADVNAANFLR